MQDYGDYSLRIPVLKHAPGRTCGWGLASNSIQGQYRSYLSILKLASYPKKPSTFAQSTVT